MPRPQVTITDEVMEAASENEKRCIEAYLECGSYSLAAAKLGMHKSNIGKAIQRAQMRAALHYPGDATEPLRRQHETHYLRSYSRLSDADGNTKLVWDKFDVKRTAAEAALQAYAEGLAADLTPLHPVPKPTGTFLPDEASAYIIGDAHLGMRAWEVETGSDDHDLDIALGDLKAASTWLVDTAPKAEVGIVVNLGDVMHCNDPSETTPASGHKLDQDTRFHMVARKSKALFKWKVCEALKHHKEVWVVIVKGNHDPDPAMWLQLLVEEAFRKEPRVKVFGCEKYISHIVFGDVFIPVYHGHKRGHNPQNVYQNITSGRFRPIHGNAKFTYAWSGHIHHKTRTEIGGVIFETFNSLVPPDQYHADNLYGASRSMTRIDLHKRYGEIGRRTCDIAFARELRKSWT